MKWVTFSNTVSDSRNLIHNSDALQEQPAKVTDNTLQMLVTPWDPGDWGPPTKHAFSVAVCVWKKSTGITLLYVDQMQVLGQILNE